MPAIGVDIVEIERVESAIKRWGERFLSRIYTETSGLTRIDFRP